MLPLASNNLLSVASLINFNPFSIQNFQISNLMIIETICEKIFTQNCSGNDYEPLEDSEVTSENHFNLETEIYLRFLKDHLKYL